MSSLIHKHILLFTIITKRVKMEQEEEEILYQPALFSVVAE